AGAGSRGSARGALVEVKIRPRRYGVRTDVDAVSFTLGPGITGLLGPNGAGKSSLMTCMAGIAAWDAGTIRIGDADVARSPRAARKLLGFMPERVAFPNEMRVTDYLSFVAEVTRIPPADRAAAL